MKRIIPFFISSWQLRRCFSLRRHSVSAQQSPHLGPGEGKFEAANPALKADAAQRGRDEGRGDHGLSSPQSAVQLSADGTQIAPHNGVWQPASRARTSSPASVICTSATTSASLRLQSAKEGTQISAVPARGPGTQPALRPALRLCANSPGQSGSGAGQGRPGLLRQHHRDQPRPLQRRRPGPNRPRPHRAAARAIRVGDSDRNRQPAHRRRSSFCSCSTTARRSSNSM